MSKLFDTARWKKKHSWTQKIYSAGPLVTQRCAVNLPLCPLRRARAGSHWPRGTNKGNFCGGGSWRAIVAGQSSRHKGHSAVMNDSCRHYHLQEEPKEGPLPLGTMRTAVYRERRRCEAQTSEPNQCSRVVGAELRVFNAAIISVPGIRVSLVEWKEDKRITLTSMKAVRWQ